MVQFKEVNGSIIVDIRGEYFGYIALRAGKFHFARGSSVRVGASGDDLREIATKCDEIAKR